MRLQVSDVISFGGFATGVFLALKARRKIFIWLFILIGVSALAVSIFSRSERTTSQQSKQSAEASGGSTINQAGRDIINQGVSEATVREILTRKLISEHEELSAKYPAGYVIFGIANGAIVAESKLTDVHLRADWNAWRVTIDESNQTVTLYISELLYASPRTRFGIRRSVERFPFRENAPVPSRYVDAGIYYEVLDATKRIFVIGFK